MLTHEELGVALLREEYVEGHIDVDEFERRIECVMHGDISVVPMGGMPPARAALSPSGPRERKG